MNEIVNRFLLAEDKFMPEMLLRQPEFTYGNCSPFTKNKEKIQKSKENGDFIFQNKLDKACFQHDTAYVDFKYLPRRRAADKVLHDQTTNIIKNPRYDGYQRGLALIIYSFLKKTTSGAVKNKIMQNKKLAAKLHKPFIRKFEK